MANSPDQTSAAAHPASEAVFQLPKDTTPTWEVELLLSGALVFSMLQVPGFLDDLMYSLRPRLTSSLNYGAFMVYMYLKITSYALIVTFVLHLASRAIWVAALGLRSVYPDGVLWEKLTRGPIYREYVQRTTMTLDEMIDKSDNRASLVFAFGLLMVLMSLSIMLFTVTLIIISELLGPWLLGVNSTWVILALVLVIVLPIISGSVIDRHFGTKIPPGHWLARGIRLTYRAGSVVVGGRSTNPILLTVFSRFGLARSNLLMLGVLYSLMAVVLVETLGRAGVIAPPGERFLPREAQDRELRAVHYADARSLDDAREGQPFIPGEIIRGPYARLFVPYIPRRLDPVIERDCHAVTRIDDAQSAAARRSVDAQRTEALLECAQQLLHPVLLDGQAIANFRYELGEDATTGLRGFVAMIDVREISRGRHELRIAKPMREGDDEPPPPNVIPFWR